MWFRLASARRLSLAALVIAILLAAASGVMARGPEAAGGIILPFGPNLKTSGWSAVRFTRFSPISFKAIGKDAVRIETSGGAGLLWRSIPESFAGSRTAKWRWQKTQGVGPTDLTQKGGDDRILAVYFAFVDSEYVKSSKDLKTLMRSGQGNFLVYVWGGSAKPGTIQKLPYFEGRGRTIIKQSANAPSATWFAEDAAIAADFKKAFGKASGRLVAIAVSSDADDTRGKNAATLADLSLM